MKKKITILYDFLKELGGLERVMFFHANVLKKRYNINLMFAYISKKEKDEIINELELEKDIDIYQIKKGKNELFNLASCLLNTNSLKNFHTNLIISFSFMASRIAAKKKKKYQTPFIIVMYHPPNFLYSSPKGWANNPARICAKSLGLFFKNSLRRMDIKSVREADLVLVGSKSISKRIEKIYGIKPKILCAPVSDFFKIISKKEIEKFKKKKEINKPFLYVHGRIIPDKNCELSLEVIEKIPNIDLIISGTIDKSYLSKLNNLIKEKKLERRVKILGRISKQELLKLYNSANLFLMTAKKEDFGLTTIESMVCGCPAIGWKDGAGSEEIIKENINGFLAKPYDLNDFISKVKLGFKKRWNKKKVADSTNKFSKKEISKEFLKIIKRVI